jgi:hypothetical protein
MSTEPGPHLDPLPATLSGPALSRRIAHSVRGGTVHTGLAERLRLTVHSGRCGRRERERPVNRVVVGDVLLDVDVETRRTVAPVIFEEASEAMPAQPGPAMWARVGVARELREFAVRHAEETSRSWPEVANRSERVRIRPEAVRARRRCG